DSDTYRSIRQWIASGAPGSRPDVPRIVKLRVTPAQTVLNAGDTQQLIVMAEYSDGSVRDVTRAAQYSSNLETIAAVDETALVQAGQSRGEATIMARYMGQVAVFNAIIPHGPPLAVIPNFQFANYID